MRRRSLAPFPAALALAASLLVLTAAAAAPQQSRAAVDLSVSGVTLEAAVRELGSAAGTPLTVEPALARRPFQLFLRGASLREAMEQIARAVATAPGRCLWEAATVQGQRGYRLLEDARSRQERERLLARLRAERRRTLEAEIETALRLARMSPEELANVREQYPELSYWMSSLKVDLFLFASLTPQQRERVLSGQAISLPYAQMTPQQQTWLADKVGQVAVGTSLPVPGRPPVELWWRSDRDLPKTSLTFRLTGQPNRPGLYISAPVLPFYRIGWPDVLHPPSLAESEQPEWMKAVTKARQQEREARERRLAEAARKDPELQRRVTLKAQRMRPDPNDPKKQMLRYSDLSDCLEQIADQSGLSILGDYDPCWDDYYSWRDVSRPGQRMAIRLMADVKNVPVWKAMSLVAERFEIEWEKDGNFLRVRSPRVLAAELDGIDLLDRRPAPPPTPGLAKALLEAGVDPETVAEVIGSAKSAEGGRKEDRTE